MQIPLQSVLREEDRKGCSHDKRGPGNSETPKKPRSPLKLNLDGTGKADIDTGIGFFDHMLDGFARHGLFDLDAECAKGIFRWTTTTPSRTPESSLAQPSGKQWETKRESAGMAAASFLWMSTLVLCAVDLVRTALSFL